MLAQESGKALLDVVSDVLDFTKIEAGQLALEHSEFSLLDTIEEAVALLASKAQRKGLETALRIDPRLPARVRGDAVRLRQIIINLVANAVAFTERGAVVVRAAADGVRT